MFRDRSSEWGKNRTAEFNLVVPVAKDFRTEPWNTAARRHIH